MDIDGLVFDEPESEANIVQDAAKESVKHATFAKLVEKMTTSTSCTRPSPPSSPFQKPIPPVNYFIPYFTSIIYAWREPEPHSLESVRCLRAFVNDRFFNALRCFVSLLTQGMRFFLK